MNTMKIGQVAHEAGVGVETLRFYEREGLLMRPDRRASGYRQYDPAVLSRLRFIQRAKALGFTLKEVKELLRLCEDETATRAEVKRRTQEKITDIEAKIADLQRMRTVLARLTESCDGMGSLDGCPIIQSLAVGETPEPPRHQAPVPLAAEGDARFDES